MNQEEKILLLGGLFHDVGKFQQRITHDRVKHQELGSVFINNLKEEFVKILGDNQAFALLHEVIREHHNRESKSDLVNILRSADHLSASERVGFDKEDSWKEKWSHKFMTSLFSKIYLNDDNPKSRSVRYYDQRLLTEKNYDIIIPQFETEDDVKSSNVGYHEGTFSEFTEDVKSVLSIYNDETDFNTVIELLLVVFEKYMWSIPDFTGSELTDISLFNHTKDVAGLAHAFYKSESENLNLIIGDLPGIQKYIFNVASSKPAKILRGRSIYVQILTRQFASIILSKLGLTDSSLVMLAGGKFYIIAPDSKDFVISYRNAVEYIEQQILIKNFNYQLNFSSVAHSFNYNKLKNKEIRFGDIIDQASYELLLKRNQLFSNILFEKDDFDENLFVLQDQFITPSSNKDSDSIKCSVTGIPIRKTVEDRVRYLDKESENADNKVDLQVKNEYEVGSQITKSNLIVELSEDYSEIVSVCNIKNFRPTPNTNRILLNPNLDELLQKENLNKDLLRRTKIIEVANYASIETNEKGKFQNVLDFSEMEKLNKGAQVLTLIKGDVDNLGLIMSSGLVGNKNTEENQVTEDLTGISRTTTLSNHLKYFFSFSLNGFLEDWESGKILDEKEKRLFPDRESPEFVEYIKDRKVYTVFAGGDDLLLVTPQSSSLKLLKTLNDTFNNFVCDNPEVHISYSLTNFKHSTPIRIVAEMAEENQSEVKRSFNADNFDFRLETHKDLFHSKNDKAGTRLFDSNIKNSDLALLISETELLIKEHGQNNLSSGLIRNLLQFSKMMSDYRTKASTTDLMWYPLLTYMINRKVKFRNRYPTPELEEFFNSILKINKSDSEIDNESMLYPIICNTIYQIRK